MILYLFVGRSSSRFLSSGLIILGGFNVKKYTTPKNEMKLLFEDIAGLK